MKKIKVLIFPSGAENAINIFDALRYNVHFELYGLSSKVDHTSFLYDKNHFKYGDYNIKSKNFFKNINRFIDKNNIKFIFPTHDEIIYFLKKNENKLHCEVIASPKDTCEVAFSKLKTAELFKNEYYYPKLYSNEKKEFPLFIKPDIGAGGKGAHLIHNEEEFLRYIKDDSYLITEYLPGDELTIDCFTNKNRELLFVGPRTRERITNGVSFNSKTVPLTKEIQKIAESINRKLIFRGLWFFQLKKDFKGNYKLMEICVRSAGTMALYRQNGINFQALSLFDFLGYDVRIINNDLPITLDRYYKSMYKIDYEYNNIYLDFDDTLIINGKINEKLMALLYQWVNNKKKIYLITKHERDIYDDLKKFKIDSDIFTKIIVLESTSKKVDSIKTRKKTIFIDNYFPERKEVLEKKGIPVFDVDAVESLFE